MKQTTLSPERQAEIEEQTKQQILSQMTRKEKRLYYRSLITALKYPGHR